MTSKGKDIYKTFKRSISGTMASVGDAFGQSSSSGVKYGGGSGKTWIHPPDVLLNGRIEYSVKLLGTKEVDKAKGTDTIRDAITAIRFQLQVKRAETGHSGAKLQKVDIQINIEGLTIVDTKTKMILHRYPLQRISFCADDKQDKRLFSFIARSENDVNRHDCFVFLSDKMAEQITLTVGEAFDLAYKRYMDRNKTSLENQKQVLFLRKRIAELESENQVLSQRLAEQIRGTTKPPPPTASTHVLHDYANTSLLDAPALPSTPMPGAPPPGMVPAPRQTQTSSPPTYSVPHSLAPLHPSDPFADLVTAPSKFEPVINTALSQDGRSTSSNSPSGPAPQGPPPPCPVLAPPPPVAPRRTVPAKNSNDISPRQENNTPSSTPKNTVFDDDFDPRAAERKNSKDKDYDPFGDDFLDDVLRVGDAAGRSTLSNAEKAQPTADDFQAMIDKVDKRLAEMKSGFDGGQLETGDVVPEESLKDLEENEYGTPVDKINQEALKRA